MSVMDRKQRFVLISAAPLGMFSAVCKSRLMIALRLSNESTMLKKVFRN
jgi:hypothetical protein